MQHEITIREAREEADVSRFWEELHDYFARDLFPEPESEDLEYFLGEEYRSAMMRIHDREQDNCRWLFFDCGGEEIGFALPVIYDSEDGKCFVMEFCIYPEFRGRGMGSACASQLLKWTKERGAAYWELNCGQERRRRFWSQLGFRENGADEWGEPLMLLPPGEEVPVSVIRLEDPGDWQLMKLMNGYKAEIGEQPLPEEKQILLSRAIQGEKIIFFVARRKNRAVGMCSVTKCWSSFSCGDTAVFEDFYVEPVFRGQGIARMLAEKAQGWCREQGIASLTVCSAPCDEEMYRALGFDVTLGRTFACITE